MTCQGELRDSGDLVTQAPNYILDQFFKVAKSLICQVVAPRDLFMNRKSSQAITNTIGKEAKEIATIRRRPW